ncbi:MAG: 2-hydroxyacid dehydrogenase [Eubacteriales bacterium]|nr:2-hydroxyacid dehydrogenase [Eubacteriales bacterium]
MTETRKIAFFDSKPYDRLWMDRLKDAYEFHITYFESRLNHDTVKLADGFDAVVAFVNDTIDATVIESLHQSGIEVIALRCAGYNHVDFKAAFGKVHVLHVPAYSPYAVAEHAAALLLSLNRKIHRAYTRTRDFNFSINGLTGFDLHGKTAGIIGTGKIGRVFIDICRGFGMNVIAYDPYPNADTAVDYVDLNELIRHSDVISLHCPLTPQTHHIISREALAMVKPNAYIINTSRGALIDSLALIDAIKEGRIGGAGLDVYEEESDFFYEDLSASVIQDDVLARLVTLPNVLITSHQAFLTEEALKNIAETTFQNLQQYFSGGPLPNEICYQCHQLGQCDQKHQTRCF